MRKIASVLVLVLLVGILAPAMAVSPADLLGTWYLSSFEYDGIAARLAGDYRIELNRDRPAVLVLNGEEQALTWEPKDYGASVTMDTRTTDFEMQEDGTLKASLTIADESSHDCIFVREEPAAAEIPEVIQASSEEDYFGTYVLTLQKTGNILLPFENGEDILKGVIEFAQVTISGSAVGSEYAIMSDYQDGKVIIPAKGIISDATDDNKVIIEKTATGIVVTMDNGSDLAYYLSSVNANETDEHAEEAAEATAEEAAEATAEEAAEEGAGE